MGVRMKRLVIGAAVLALSMHGVAPAQKWVPLNSSQSKVMQGQVPPKPSAAPATAPTPGAPPAMPQTTVVVVPVPGKIAPTPVSSQPVTAQSAPMNVPVMAVPAGAQQPLALTCLGAGTANKATSAVAWGWGGWGVVAGHKDRAFNDQVDIRLFTADDRIRLPRTMLPGLHGGDHGWFKVHDLVADARDIRLSAGVGILNNPKVFIDRVTGTISISGKSGDYAGQCEVIDPNAPAKF